MERRTSIVRRYLSKPLHHLPRCSYRQNSKPTNMIQYSTMDQSTGTENIPPCPICLETMKEPKANSCGHTFCSGCHESWSLENRSCPLCRQVNPTESLQDTTSQSNANPFEQRRPPGTGNAIYNQALIDNYRIQHGRYPKEVKKNSRQLIEQMKVYNQTNSNSTQNSDISTARTLPQEADLMDRQQAISNLLQHSHSGRR